MLLEVLLNIIDPCFADPMQSVYNSVSQSVSQFANQF